MIRISARLIVRGRSGAPVRGASSAVVVLVSLTAAVYVALG